MVSLQRQRQKQQLLSQQEARNHDPHFPIGSEVEVSSDKEGLKGVWYPAKVLKSSPSKSLKTKLCVEYRTLLSDKGSEPRKTLVDCKYVRPLPPTEEEEGSFVFRVNDAVDAYYNDGWWEDGVVTRVAGDRRYIVFFQNPPRELEFSRSDLRVHKDWIDGKWLWPEKQKMKEFSFSPRTKVEVNLDRSHDRWLPATVISPTIAESGEESYLVQLKSQVDSMPLKLVVGLRQIRPSPPSFPTNVFHLLEKVDAFYDGGWSSGVVTKVLGQGRHIVFFKHTKKEKEITHKELRVHMEWINGKWFHSSQDVFISSSTQEQLDSTFVDRENGAVALLECSESTKEIIGEESAAVILKKNQEHEMPYSGTDAVTLSYKKTRGSKNFENQKPFKMSGEETSVGADVSSITCQQKTPQMVAENDQAGLNLVKSNVKQGDTASPKTSKDGSQHFTKVAAVLRGLGNDKTEVDSPEDQRTAVIRKRGRPPKSGAKSLQVLVTDAASVSLDNRSMMRSEESVFVIGLACNVDERIPSVTRPVELPKDIPVKVVQYDKAQGEIEHKEQKDGGGNVVKRKRGRPPKLLADCPKTPGAGKELAGQNNKKRARLHDVDSPSVVVEPAGTRDVMPHATHKFPVRDQAGKEGQRWKIARGVGSFTQDHDVVLEEENIEVPTDGSLKGAHAPTAPTPNSIHASDDDRPLSTWLEGAHSPQGALDDTRLALDEAGHQLEKNTDIPDSLKVQSPVQSNQVEKTKQGGVSVEDISHEDARERDDEIAVAPVVDLPFVKSSLIWKTLESMEVFQLIPQKPHFTPLYKHKEECREGLAIGNMVTFASLVEKVSKYRFEDPKPVLASSLDALVDLENFGFDVNPVRQRLRTLINLKERHEQAQSTSKEIGTQIMDRSKEKSKINEEIEVLDGQIKQLREKRAFAVLLQERKDSEISILRSSVDAAKESIEGARAEFERVATAPW